MSLSIRISLTVSLLCGVAAGQEWTRFRGPNGGGRGAASARVPDRWTASDFGWRVKLPGKGHSSPVLWGKRVFVTAGEEQAEGASTRVVAAHDADSGRQLWSRRFSASTYARHKLNSFASSTPAVDAHRLYVCWVDAERLIVTAFDHDGRTTWQKPLGRFRAGYGHGVSPILHRDLLIVSNDQQGDSSIVALETATGRVRWQTDRASRVGYSTPCIRRRAGTSAEVILTSWERGIEGIDIASGRSNWSLQVFDQKHVETPIASPIVVGDLVLGTCGWLGYAMHTVAVRPGKRPGEAADEVFRVDRGAPLCTTPVANSTLLFLWSDQGIVTCVRMADGSIAWRERVGGTFYGSPVLVGKRLICLSASGQAIVMDAAETARVVARNPILEGSHSTPAIAHRAMFVRTFSHLARIGGD